MNLIQPIEKSINAYDKSICDISLYNHITPNYNKLNDLKFKKENDFLGICLF